MEREACVCDNGFERSDLCAEIIIIIIIIITDCCESGYIIYTGTKYNEWMIEYCCIYLP